MVHALDRHLVDLESGAIATGRYLAEKLLNTTVTNECVPLEIFQKKKDVLGNCLLFLQKTSALSTSY